MLPLYFVKCKKYFQQQQQLDMLSEHEIAFISSPTTKCPLQLPCEVTKLSNIHGSGHQKVWPKRRLRGCYWNMVIL